MFFSKFFKRKKKASDGSCQDEKFVFVPYGNEGIDRFLHEPKKEYRDRNNAVLEILNWAFERNFTLSNLKFEGENYQILLSGNIFVKTMFSETPLGFNIQLEGKCESSVESSVITWSAWSYPGDWGGVRYGCPETEGTIIGDSRFFEGCFPYKEKIEVSGEKTPQQAIEKLFEIMKPKVAFIDKIGEAFQEKVKSNSEYCRIVEEFKEFVSKDVKNILKI